MWDGNSMSQSDFMEKDTVLVLSESDIVIGSESKKSSHVFSVERPRAVVHRAFSVFLFDEQTGNLLLQRRAASKVTFPNVWTNTCCSHQLHGMVPSEIDSPTDVQNGTVSGSKNAAVRKLFHELGIPQEQLLPIERFKFLTRLHYWAADTKTHGTDSPWGENEIDYILFITVPSKESLTLVPHADEVDAIRWVNQSELKQMMSDPDLLFSPWFRIIANKWLLPEKSGWWSDLHVTMTTNTHCDFVNIHRFDPPAEHLGGAGKAGPLYSSTDTKADDSVKKQGAYGKIQIHKESKWEQMSHLDEVWAAIALLYINPMQSNLDTDYCNKTFHPGNLAFCDEILGKVSRSFAVVIRQLPPVLFVDIMIFYLVLRALDTIEDDMKAFESNDVKVKHLLSIHETALGDPSWSMDGVGEGDERRLLQEFPKCHSVYAALRGESKAVIAEITKRMAAGMAEFVGKDLGQGTEDIIQYNRYCHFVAGLVGEGLSKLFAVSGLENASMAKELHLSNQMGLFLQKTNIIRDYLEDYVEGRAFWPQTVWKKYSKDGDLGYFAKDENRVEALQCLNELITDALELVPDCLAYLAKLKCLEVYRFCAIPQVMAIATLDKCYHNGNVFTGVVKIRKGLSCKLINATSESKDVHAIFWDFAKSIAKKARKAKKSGFEDPSYTRTIKACDEIIEATLEYTYIAKYINRTIYFLAVGLGVSWYFKVKQVLVVFVVLFGFMMYMTTMSDLAEAQELKEAILIVKEKRREVAPKSKDE